MAEVDVTVSFGFQFLTDSQGFECRVPDGTMIDEPEVSSIVAFEDEDRQLVFRPYVSAIGPQSDASFEYSTVRGPAKVSVYRSASVPSRHLVFWFLSSGVLATFVPEPDSRFPAESAPGTRGVDAIVQSVTIEDGAPIPHVLGGGPVRIGGRYARPGADRVALQNAAGWPAVNFIKLLRSPGQVSSVSAAPWKFATGDEFALVWADSPAGVRVECLGPNRETDALKTFAAEIAESVVEV
jgi:hypothetical protein